MDNKPFLEQVRALGFDSARAARKHWCRSLSALMLISAVCAWLCCYTVRELPDPELLSSRVLAFSVAAVTCLLVWFVGQVIMYRHGRHYPPRA